MEQYRTISYLAELLDISREKARQLIRDEPGVMKLQAAKPVKGATRLMYRIPESVITRIVCRSSNPA